MTPLDFLHDYERASAAHDLPGTMRFIADDAVYFFSNESTHLGKAAVQAAIAANFDAIRMESFELKNMECLLETEESAVFIFEYHWAGEIQRTACSGFGRGTTVLRRHLESWQIVHEHLSRGSFSRLPANPYAGTTSLSRQIETRRAGSRLPSLLNP